MTIRPEWKELLMEVALSGANHAEQAADLMSKADPNVDVSTTMLMRDRYLTAREHLEKDEDLTQEDYTYLWIAASISKQLIEKKIEAWSAVVDAYVSHLIPSLYTVAALPPEEQAAKFKEIFTKEFDKT